MNADQGIALHVEDRGFTPSDRNATPLVMVHGWGMNLRVFDALRERLGGLPTRAIDLPGHGRSPWWPEAAQFDVLCGAVLEALPPRCVLLGWSLGAKVAMQLATQQPGRIAALVLVGATPKFARSADWPHGMEQGALRAFRSVLEQDWRQTLEDFLWLQVRGSRDAEATAQSLRGALLAQGEPRREALLAHLALLETIDLRALVRQITQPALLVTGRNDRVTPPGAAEWMAGEMKAAGLLELPRAGHAPQLSHADELAATLRAYFAAWSAGMNI